MKKISVILFALALLGCQATTSQPAPVFTSEVIEVTVDELPDYWVAEPTKMKMLKKRPDWLPKGKGEWTVLTVIDSNGNEVEKTLISSEPEGFMTQQQVDEMPRAQYKPAESNKNRVPVKFYGTARIATRSEL